MTTKSTQITGASFTKRVSKAKIPYYDQCLGFYIFGDSAALSVVNQISGQPNLTVVGAPTFPGKYATVSITNGFDTGYIADAPYTYCFLAQSQPGGGGSYVNREAGGEAFYGMIRYKDDAAATIDHWSDGVQKIVADNMQSPNFRFVGGFFPAAANMAAGGFYSDSSGRDGLVYRVVSTPTAKTVTPTKNLRFGGGGNWGAGRTGNVAMAAVFNFSMNPMQVREVMNFMKALAAVRGLTLV